MSRPVKEEAADLLACLASQPNDMSLYIFCLPGRWSASARDLARLTWMAVQEDPEIGPMLDDREHYAESESRLRSEAP